MLVHTVFFYFKEGVSEEELEANKAAALGLGRIETVKQIFVGTQANVAIRPVSVTGWGFALTVIFDNAADHDVYQDHPIHLEFIKGFSHLWEKVRVFDAD